MKRYQVFISSTYTDLVDERAEAARAVSLLGHFPAGMELFAASPDTPWEVIKKVIDDSDYYVLVIGGRYGSTNDNGVSFTEREYDYAREKRKHILAFVHENTGEIPSAKVDLDPDKRKQLEQFTAKVQGNHTTSTWKSSADLATSLTVALARLAVQYPEVGWVRAEGPDAVELLAKQNALHEEIARLRQEVDLLRSRSISYQSEDDLIDDLISKLEGRGPEWFLEISSHLHPPTFLEISAMPKNLKRRHS